ncbi:MAG TPA: surface-adhesin E family protein [Caulobacteraceae bacterium]|nr:surface-adhesin E family protein [Caulobacteraceae bacterium]
MTAIERLKARWLAPAAAVAMLCLGAPAGAHAEGRQADSDDYICNHGAPDDPATIDACGRLRGTTSGMNRDLGRERDSDDYNCSHGAPGDPATIEACQHLRGGEYTGYRDEGHQRNNDDWLCHSGAPGDPRTQEACARLRGYAEASRHGRISVIHIVRDLPGPRRAANGRTYRSVRYTIELNCEAGVRRRIATARYAGRHATGGWVEGGRSVGAWRPAGAACG